jgi:hypothetical protein
MKKPVNSLGDRMDDFDFVVVSRAEEKAPKPQPKKPAPKSLQN